MKRLKQKKELVILSVVILAVATFLFIRITEEGFVGNEIEIEEEREKEVKTDLKKEEGASDSEKLILDEIMGEKEDLYQDEEGEEINDEKYKKRLKELDYIM